MYLAVKRVGDFCAALAGVIFLLPLLALIALAIKLTSKGPVLFLQERVGKDQKVFRICKFRTMVVGAEKIGDGLTIKSANDSRITPVGRFLRATSLDELPQLFNVVKGDMSLVGPRPPVTYHPYPIGGYPDQFIRRFDLRPGITGLAQVTVRNSVPWDERMAWDIKYVDQVSLALDIKILWLTLLRVLRPSGIYK